MSGSKWGKRQQLQVTTTMHQFLGTGQRQWVVIAFLIFLACTTTASPGLSTTNPSKDNSIGVIIGAFIGCALFLAVVVFLGIQMKKRKEDVGASVRALQRLDIPVKSPDQTSAQRSSSPVDTHDQSFPSALAKLFMTNREKH